MRKDLPSRRRTRSIPSTDTAEGARAERRRIGRELHQGILQDLTVAGFRLKTLEDAAQDDALKTEVNALAAWLRSRQAALRTFVTDLEAGENSGGQVGLSAVAEALLQRGCVLSFDAAVDVGGFEHGIDEAILRATGELTELLATSLGTRSIAIRGDPRGQPRLHLHHDGPPLRSRPEDLAAVRSIAGRNGASLRIEARPAGEILVLDWTS